MNEKMKIASRKEAAKQKAREAKVRLLDRITLRARLHKHGVIA